MTTETTQPLKLALETSRLGARSRSKLDMAEKLPTGALELFLERGYDEVPVSEIAERAGVTSRTFFRYFRYFPSKETVLLDITDQTNFRLIEILGAVVPGAKLIDALRAAPDAVVWGIRRDSPDGGPAGRELREPAGGPDPSRTTEQYPAVRGSLAGPGKSSSWSCLLLQS